MYTYKNVYVDTQALHEEMRGCDIYVEDSIDLTRKIVNLLRKHFWEMIKVKRKEDD